MSYAGHTVETTSRRNLAMFNPINTTLRVAPLLLAFTAFSSAAYSQTCADHRQGDCGSGTMLGLPVGANTEAASAVLSPGFAISVNGSPGGGDPRLIDLQRKADLALAAADIQVRFDGLEIERRLDARVIHDEVSGQVTFQSRLNYPAFVTRGEVRIVDTGGHSGPRIVEILPIVPGGRVTTKRPEGDNLVYFHRVYDEQGRFDETFGLPLSDNRDLTLSAMHEEGRSSLRRKGVRIAGGAITVSGSDLPAATRVRTLGEVVTADAAGSFVIQRILPVGEHAVEISAATVDLTRDVAIPGSEWFHVGIVDITMDWRDGDDGNASGQARGRIAAYVRGRTADGTQVVISVDAQEEDLDAIFRSLNRRDPRSLLRRLDPDDLYPTYGDDSHRSETAPTSGRFYIKVEKNGNFALWGNYKANISGSEYIRNERTLYGAQLHGETGSVLPSGAAQGSIDLYAAHPDNLPQRDIFRGTGGSVYFLSRQDISVGSETVSIESRDPDTNRVLNRRTLTRGVDYDINYLQGVVRLPRPLVAYDDAGHLIKTNPNGDDVNLVVHYEWTPVALEVDSYAYGGRAALWVDETLRLGITGQSEKTASDDQKVLGVDLDWRPSDTTWFEAEFARSEGPGLGNFSSVDGGLSGIRTPSLNGTGNAYRFAAQADLQDVDLATPGLVGGYFEHRGAGFSSLDYAVPSDETLWGVYGEADFGNGAGHRFYADFYENNAGRKYNEVGIETAYRLTGESGLSLGIEHLDVANASGTSAGAGSRTDAGLRYDHTVSDRASWNVFGQATLSRTGTVDANNRIGVGGRVRLNEHLDLEGEVSDGTHGRSAQALIRHDDQQGKSTYFGYTLDPDPARFTPGFNDTGGAKFVAGSKWKLSDATRVYMENRYDLFATSRTLTGTYGIDYKHSEFTDYSAVVEVGGIKDPAGGDFRRSAVSLGYAHDNKTTALEGRLEYRRERGVDGHTHRNADTVLFSGSLRHKLSKSRRIITSLDGVYTDSDNPALANTRFAEVSLGYADRPITHDRFNFLARYRFVYDEYGQVIATGANTQVRGPLQHSHILSLDAEYDLNQRWSTGGKIGYRFSETATNGTDDFTSNNALLTIANTRYHVTHKWDLLAELRLLDAQQAEYRDAGMLFAAYRHIGAHAKLGVGYNLTSFSDDLADVVHDDGGFFINLIAKF